MSNSFAKSFKFLTHGIDTIEICYYLDMRKPSFDFEKLAAQRDGMDKKKRYKGSLLKLGGKEFILSSHGSSSGYPFVISNPDCIIQFGEFNNPSFYVRFISKALWEKGLQFLHTDFLSWAQGLGLMPIRKESISRIDACFDYLLPLLDFNEDCFVTDFTKDNKHRGHRKTQTFMFGKGDAVLRIYDKSTEVKENEAKNWFFEIWGQSENVWRIEWQFRKKHLRDMQIIAISDMDDSFGFLLKFFCCLHTSIRVRTNDSNSSRWPVHPLWQDLQERIDLFGQQEKTPLPLDLNKIPERIQRNIISMMGYLKHIAAMVSLYDGTPPQPYQSILNIVQKKLFEIYDPMTWSDDVQTRIDHMRLTHE